MPVNAKQKVVMGMSGGVDSSVAAMLLQEQGYEVIGVTMKLWHDSRYDSITEDNSADAKKICDLLGIQHYTLDLADEFKKYVVDNFIECYARALTPNPCVECNKHLKFGAMFEFADKLGAEFVATGHYAQRCYDEKFGMQVIKKSNSLKKDQSYVLYVIKKEYVPRVLFPLGEFESKEQIRAIAAKNGFISAKKPDSQEICFIPDNDTAGFLDMYIKPRCGDILNKSGNVLGRHTGLAHYTIGQRKGLGISAPQPLFVTDIDAETNTVFVGSNSDLFSNVLYAENMNWLIFDDLKAPLRAYAKIRYAAKEVPAQVIPCSGGKVKVVFDEPQRAATPGQSVVFYINDCVIGGGIITKRKSQH